MDFLRSIVDRIGVADIIALVLVLTSAFIWLTNGEIPESLLSVTLIVVGFFFGENTAKRTQAATIESLNPKPAPGAVGIEREG